MKIKEVEKYHPIFNSLIRQSIVPQSEFGKHSDDGQIQVTVRSINPDTVTVVASRTIQLVLPYTGDGSGVRLGDKLVIHTRTGNLTLVGEVLKGELIQPYSHGVNLITKIV